MKSLPALTATCSLALALVCQPAVVLAGHHGAFHGPVVVSPFFPRPVVPHPVFQNRFVPNPFFFHRHFVGPVFVRPFVPFVVSAPPVVVVTSPSVVYSQPPGVYSQPPGVYSQPPVAYAPPAAPMPTVVEYPIGRYELRGDGITTPYRWVWIPNPPPGPPPAAPAADVPPPPSAPPAEQTPPARHGAVFCGTDGEGVTTWTDQPDKIPARYRVGAEQPLAGEWGCSGERGPRSGRKRSEVLASY